MAKDFLIVSFYEGKVSVWNKKKDNKQNNEESMKFIS